MRRLLDLLGVLVLVLLLSAFDERGAERTVTRARAELAEVWTRVSPPAPATDLPTRAADHALRGSFAATTEATPWPSLHADGAQIEIAGLGVLHTGPYRIATGSEPPFAAAGLDPGQQVELREITDTAPVTGGQPLCAEYPARYLALAGNGRTLRLLAFADRPEGDARACADLAFRIP
ncbi:hypothetical protein [Brevundimonas sp.]|uniref:hypothetical protein n=1 Tax=Brevundimonas sp. TaxID=1871086 RepID=UPI003AF4B004